MSSPQFPLAFIIIHARWPLIIDLTGRPGYLIKLVYSIQNNNSHSWCSRKPYWIFFNISSDNLVRNVLAMISGASSAGIKPLHKIYQRSHRRYCCFGLLSCIPQHLVHTSLDSIIDMYSGGRPPCCQHRVLGILHLLNM